MGGLLRLKHINFLPYFIAVANGSTCLLDNRFTADERFKIEYTHIYLKSNGLSRPLRAISGVVSRSSKMCPSAYLFTSVNYLARHAADEMIFCQDI